MSGQTNVDIRRAQAGDAEALADFYNALGRETVRMFRPLGEKTSADVCRRIVEDNHPDRAVKFDLVAFSGPRIVGWCFLWNIQTGAAKLGLGIADDHQRRGLGSTLMDRMMAVASGLALTQVALTVLRDNQMAWRMYEKYGFVRHDEFVSNTDGLTYLRMACDLGSDNVIREQCRRDD